MATFPKTLILGIGNILWADEGFGVRAIEKMQTDYEFPPEVTLLDGGTQGVYLLQYICEAEVLVVLDAVDYGLPGGTLKRVEGDKVPKFLGCKKVSLHQTGFQEVLALADMLNQYPKHLLLVGVQPVELEDYGGSLRPQVKAQLTPAIEMALEYLAQFGIRPQRLAENSNENAAARGAFDATTLDAYELGRPSAEQACRQGDERILRAPEIRLGDRSPAIEGMSVAVDQHLDPYRQVED